MGQEFVTIEKIFVGPHLDSFSSLDKFWWPTFCDKEEDEKWIRLGESVLIRQTSCPKGQGHCHFDLGQVKFDRNLGIIQSLQSPVSHCAVAVLYFSVIWVTW